ncbi:S-adenosyl-L-methionine-dependent methyltransferases superfamily protein [Artemisia annua]|uniref:S-adenosyl-L-methionine-dependent methyltransferases superfamily protein n=1 Tax=Artemisia annua TaxID=35608 RepID=A0A2U1MAL5_ARTAN|nr:S-adenosyl-L-methionine-dependent methyltransferases superfamily protein [Artemisia annua]
MCSERFPWFLKLQPSLKSFKWNLNPKSTTILNIKNQYDPIKSQSSSAGKIKRLVLTKEGRTKFNITPDRDFYAFPRFVTHVVDNFIATLTALYKERLDPEYEVLDLMSSWVSHLPNDVNFDAVLCTVSVQYLQEPEKVFAEVFRMLRPGGVFIVSFSNRMFYEKAIGAWREGTGYGRVQLVVQYFQSVEGFTEPEVVRKQGDGMKQDCSVLDLIKGFLGLLSGSDPFYVVIAYKNFKPIYE